MAALEAMLKFAAASVPPPVGPVHKLGEGRRPPVNALDFKIVMVQAVQDDAGNCDATVFTVVAVAKNGDGALQLLWRFRPQLKPEITKNGPQCNALVIVNDLTGNFRHFGKFKNFRSFLKF